MDILVENLNVKVPGKGKGQVPKTLLEDVNFKVDAGDVVALMGPSGAGKTTLLNRVVGRGITGEVTGTISYNGNSIERGRSGIGYVTQDDTMYETLTPRENLKFAAAFLQGGVDEKGQNDAVVSVMQKLRLVSCADTIVGTPGLIKGISGGERKRTNVALSLLSNPSLLLLDEPTSGLDSKMADEMMKDVSGFAEQGCTVVATIHQPSEAVFARFTKVLLLAGGRIEYYGLVEGLRDKLEKLGLASVQQITVPLPEILLDIIEAPTEGVAERENALAEFRALSISDAGASGVGGVAESSPLRELQRLTFCRQLIVLFRRNALNFRRNKVLTVVRLGQTLGSTLLIGWLFVQVESNLSGVNVRMFGVFLLAFAQFLFAMLGVVNTFPQERAVFLREAQDRWYHPAAFYLAKVFLDTLVQSSFPIIVTAIGYPMIGLNTSKLERVLCFYLFLVLLSNCGAAVGFAVSAAVSNVSTALSMAPGMIMPQLILSGLFIRIEKMPQPFHTLSYLVLVRYALQGLIVNEFTCETNPKCTPVPYRMISGDQCSASPCDFCCDAQEVVASGGVCPVLTCDDALNALGLGMDTLWPTGDTNTSVIVYNLIALVALLILFRTVGMIVLMVSYRRAAKSG
mmetsp:Transcript_25943/g.72380  ORF Transcript_25943/g.72380 Transcript_25943/m.72380 type:complete len:628 (+) Transcript_25943:127-2010(+)